MSRVIQLFCLLLCLGGLAAAEGKEFLHASSYQGAYFNQNWISGNACGPAAILNSFLTGSLKNSETVDELLKLNSKNAISELLKTYGNTPSKSLSGQKKWNPKRGMNQEDLLSVLKELNPKYRKRYAIYYTADQPLKATYKQLRKSLKKGFPPIVSVRRFVKKDKGEWFSLGGHYMSLVGLGELGKSNLGITMEYVDPKGALMRKGVVMEGSEKGHNFGHSINLTRSNIFEKEAAIYDQSTLVLSSFILLK